jgi:hypothetical protein
MPNLPTDWKQLLVSVVAIVILSLLLAGIRRLQAAVATSADGSQIAAVLQIINDVVRDAVGEIEQTIVGELKVTAQDGKLTNDEVGRVKNGAVEKAWANIPTKWRAIAQTEFGVDDLRPILATKVEAEVGRMRAAAHNVSKVTNLTVTKVPAR